MAFIFQGNLWPVKDNGSIRIELLHAPLDQIGNFPISRIAGPRKYRNRGIVQGNHRTYSLECHQVRERPHIDKERGNAVDKMNDAPILTVEFNAKHFDFIHCVVFNFSGDSPSLTHFLDCGSKCLITTAGTPTATE